jgi:predicted CoA-substrate-specific enzyme activase
MDTADSVVGIDIGSRTIALVEFGRGEVVRSELTDTTHDPLSQCNRLLSGGQPKMLYATGYGRHMLRKAYGASVLTEIKAFAIGANSINAGYPGILDVGGQDVKVIKLSDEGKVADFEMNDRCAAGTGKFLEVMAKALDYTLDEFGEAAMKAPKPSKINSMCTVFAESEVVSLIGAGEERENIAYGVHEAIAERVVAMINRVGISGDLFFAGGGARNRCLKKILEDKLRIEIFVPEDPQIVGALGAALSAP